MLARYSEFKGHKTNGPIEKTINNFWDGKNVSSWAVDAMNWAISNGLISGDGSDVGIHPQGNSWRIHCAAMISKLKKDILVDVTLPEFVMPTIDDSEDQYIDESEESPEDKKHIVIEDSKAE